MAAKATQTSFAEWYEDVPWSEDAYGAPWWINPEAEKRMAEFARDLLSESKYTPDMPSLALHNDQLVFVYGTLKRGFINHDMLNDATFVARGWTALKRFRMVQGGGFPVALFNQDEAAGKAIQGEVYKVPIEDIKYLDAFEGNGSMYRRRRMAMELDNGKTKPCWMYLGIPEVFTALDTPSPVFKRKKNNVEYYAYTRKTGK